MHWLDYIMVLAFFGWMVWIGHQSKKHVKTSDDFFTGGGKIPWWVSGISHHVSGYSGVVFVGYAAIAYNYGFTLYIFWAVGIAVAMFIGAVTIVPRWPRLRKRLGIQSPTEYLVTRYGVSAQQITAWAGIVVKLLDVGAKWASIGILLSGFTGMPIWVGIVFAGIVSLYYITVGGLWADIMTDLAQFVVQILGGLVLFFAVMAELGGPSCLVTLWQQLPPANHNLFSGPYTPVYVFAYWIVCFLSYTGGTWNLATRFISTKDSREARRSATLSAVLYFVWPLVLFFPMWAGPVLFPNMADPANELYSKLTTTFLPPGLVGLVLASMFANTLSMTVSDANVVSAVLQRDVLPILSKKLAKLRDSLTMARITTIIFTTLTIIVALFRDYFGDVIGLILTWFAALLGPTAIPLLCGLFRPFKHADNKAAIISVLAGFMVFVANKYMGLVYPADLSTIMPTIVAFAAYCIVAAINSAMHKPIPERVNKLFDMVEKPDFDVEPEEVTAS